MPEKLSPSPSETEFHAPETAPDAASEKDFEVTQDKALAAAVDARISEWQVGQKGQLLLRADDPDREKIERRWEVNEQALKQAGATGIPNRLITQRAQDQVFDEAKTAYQRLLTAGEIAPAERKQLEEVVAFGVKFSGQEEWQIKDDPSQHVKESDPAERRDALAEAQKAALELAKIESRGSTRYRSPEDDARFTQLRRLVAEKERQFNLPLAQVHTLALEYKADRLAQQRREAVAQIKVCQRQLDEIITRHVYHKTLTGETDDVRKQAVADQTAKQDLGKQIRIGMERWGLLSRDLA